MTNENKEYSIATLLLKLADDKLEAKMIEILSRNITDEEALQLLLKEIKEGKL